MIQPKYFLTSLYCLVLTTFIGAQNFTISQNAITTCDGFFFDNGGAANYGINEDFTTTICSDGSQGSHIQLIFSGIDIGAGESIQLYDANTADPAFLFDNGFLLTPNQPFIIQATAANPSGCVTIHFTSDAIDEGNAGWSASINCVASCQTIEAVLVASNPTVFPIDTGWIDICPGDLVNLSAGANFPQNNLSYAQDVASCTFEWDFGDGTRGYGPNVAHTYNESGGYTIRLTVTDNQGCQNTNFLQQRIRVSPLPLFTVNPLDSTICLNDTINISSSVNSNTAADVEVQSNTAFFSPTSLIADTLLLPDGIGTSYESSLYFTQFPAGATLQNPEDILGVLLHLEHSYYGDLEIELICPDGTSIALLERVMDPPNGSTNLGNPFATAPTDNNSSNTSPGYPYAYTFVNNAANGTLIDFSNTLTAQQITSAPDTEVNIGTMYQYVDMTFPEGEYSSSESFANLIGCPLNGQWTIRVTDHLNQDNGWLFGWGIEFNPNLFSNIESFSPDFVSWDWQYNPSVISSTPSAISASPEHAGVATYTFYTEDSFGCTYDTTLQFEVLPEQHPDCIDCDFHINEQEDLLLCQGDMSAIDLSPNQSLSECVTFEQYPDYDFGAANHPYTTPYASILEVNSLPIDTISNPLTQICSICIDVSTDILSDIQLILEAPNGAQILLSEANGGNAATGYVNTCFAPTSLMEISNGSPPFTGSFQPQQANGWSNLIGSAVNGNWTLWVADCCNPLELSTLDQWSIAFNVENEYSYDWQNSNGLSCDDCPTPSFTANSSNNYIVEIEDIYGCSQNDTISVQLVEDLNAPTLSCNAENNGILFEWSAVGINSFEYQLTINTVDQGWQSTMDEELFVNNLQNGDNVSIEVRPLVNSMGLNCSIPSSSSNCIAVVCDLEIGQVSTTPSSCFNTSTGSVTIELTAGTAPFSFQISGDPTTYNATPINNLAPGAYTYTVSNADGCEVAGDFEIGSPDSLILDLVQTYQACYGEDLNEATASASGGMGGNYTFEWSHGESGSQQNNLAAGHYEVSLSDASGCMLTDTITIASLDSISFNFIANPPSCFGLSDGAVGINQITGGAGMDDDDYNYVWEDGSTEIVRTMLVGGTSYSVTVSDQQGCSASRSRDLPQPEEIVIELAASDPICQGDHNGSIQIIAPADIDNYDIVWTSNANGQDSSFVDGLAAGNYSVSITSTAGCMANKDTVLIDPELMQLTLSTVDNDCYNGSTGSISVAIEHGTAPFTYQWSNSVTTAINDQLFAGSYQLTLTDANNCFVTASADIDQPSEVIIEITTDSTSCFGDRDGSISINMQGGTPPFSYTVNNDFTSGSPSIIGLTAGNYDLLIQDAKNCNYYETASVGEPEEFMIDAGDDIRIAYGQDTTLSVEAINNQGDISYFWSEPYAGTLSCLMCPDPVAAPLYTIDYSVLAVDENGCEAEDLIRIFIEKNYVVEVPTAFTPDGNLINDRLIVHGSENITVLDFEIYDRWGELLYKNGGFDVNNDSAGWDGNYRDEPMSGGVYVWKAEVLYPDGRKELLNGQTTLIR